jgi:hypothetical protein
MIRRVLLLAALAGVSACARPVPIGTPPARLALDSF